MINSGFFSNMVSGGDNGHGHQPVSLSHLQTFRMDSEELFKNWITSEESHRFNSSSMVHRTPQAMERKDSEQTKQLEELQIHHEELTNEKEHMLEEIERILAARGKM